MALAVFFLLAGVLAAELTLFGLEGAGVVGAALFAACAVVLVRRQREMTMHR